MALAPMTSGFSVGDPDQVFSYNSRQEVNFNDRCLGCTYAMATLLIVVYVGFYDFYMQQGYLELEGGRGVSVTQVAGEVFAHSEGTKQGQRYFSSEELSAPGLENGNAFVATKVAVETQKRGVCEDKSMPCNADSDCSQGVDSQCAEDGFCREPSWCNDGQGLEEYRLPTSDYLLWVKTAIQYLQLKPGRVFVSEMTKPIVWPEKGHNAFRVRDLLALCDPQPVQYEEISELGAAIEVQTLYNCNTDMEPCTPELKVRRLDTVMTPDNIGFTFKQSRSTGVEDERELLTYSGVRFYFRTVGTGSRVDFGHIIMKLSTACALLGLANLVTDFLMIHLHPNAKKNFARKYLESEDFSDRFRDYEEEQLHAEEPSDDVIDTERIVDGEEEDQVKPSRGDDDDDTHWSDPLV